MRDFEKLQVWSRSVRLSQAVYDEVGRFRGPERFEAISQLVRAADSIGANIAEGAGRESRRDYARFLTYALGSTNEVDHFLVLLSMRGLIARVRVSELRRDVDIVRRMLIRLRTRVRA